jgi:hypothetical protein
MFVNQKRIYNNLLYLIIDKNNSFILNYLFIFVI